jgi:hypothetical protein
MILQIVTTETIGEKIHKHFNFIEQNNIETTLHLGDITDYVGYTIVQIELQDNIHQHNLIDMFWLGYYVGIDNYLQDIL